MDILGPLPTSDNGNKYILIVSDYFTRWVEAYPITDQEARSIADILTKEFICRFGVPLLIHTDQGRNFESKLMVDIKKTRTTAYTIHSQMGWLKSSTKPWKLSSQSLPITITETGTNTFPFL